MRGIVNGYKIVVKRREEGEKYNLRIRYLKDGEFFSNSTLYEELNMSTILEVGAHLKDWTRENLKATRLCETIPWMTMIHEVEEIIYKK